MVVQVEEVDSKPPDQDLVASSGPRDIWCWLSSEGWYNQKSAQQAFYSDKAHDALRELTGYNSFACIRKSGRKVQEEGEEFDGEFQVAT